jgi:hypothetical protein
MPCRSSCASVSQSPFESHNNDRLKDEINGLKDRNNQLEAMMCALVNELYTQLDKEECYIIFNRAGENGKVDLSEWIKKHREEDKERLKEEVLNKLSKHELDLIKELLK